MRAGKYRHRCRIEAPVAAKDATYGAATPTWSTVATVWCEKLDVLPARAESQGSALVLSRQPARLRMRYRTDVDSAMRIVMLTPGSEVIHQIIGGPAELGNKEQIELLIERISS